MSTMVIGPGNLYLKYPSIAVPTTILNLSCYATALEIGSETEEIDVGVMCAAGLVDQGITTYSATISMLWEPALYTVLQPQIGIPGELQYSHYSEGAADATRYIRFLTRFAAQPWGRFEIGQRVEVELPLAVLSTPAWIDAP